MAYKGRRVKKKPLGKNPIFWVGIVAVVVVLTLVILISSLFNPDKFTVRAPDPTTVPTSMEKPETLPTVETTTPPEENPYGPVDFMLDEETQEMTFLSGEGIKGIDVSSWQGNIDWQQVKDSGVEFVIIRVGGRGTTEGNIYPDEMCQTYYEGAKAAGLKVGAYFFSQSITEEEAIEEAEYVLDVVKDWDVEMPIVYDWEYIGDGARTDNMVAGLLTEMAKAYCETVKNAGYDPMIYFGRSQSADLLILPELEEYGFWLAMYNPIMDYPYKIDIWQYTETGSVPGISGNVDLNLWIQYE